MTSTFEGAEIDGKQFPFVRVTVTKQKQIINRFKVTLRSAILEKFFPQGNNTRMWRRVRSIAFVKDWKWRYFHIIPKELRCSEIGLKQAGEIQASFFAYVREIVEGHDKLLTSAMSSKIQSESTK